MKNILNIMHWIEGAFLKAYDNDVNDRHNNYNKAGRSIINLPAKMILHHRHPAIPGKLLASRACLRLTGLHNIQEIINIGKHYLRSLAYQNLKNPRRQMSV